MEAEKHGGRVLERLKRSLVQSYIGAIALGYLLAQTILHFVGVFAAPLAGWVSRKQYGGFLPHSGSLPGFSLQDAVPELVRFAVLLLVWYVLVRWLYFPPVKETESNPQ
jgi:Zn-dependent protease